MLRKDTSYLAHNMGPGYFHTIKEIKAFLQSDPYQNNIQDVCLNLSNRTLLTLPPILFQVKRLKVLNLSYNKLFFLPPEIMSLKALRELNISCNPNLELSQEIKYWAYINTIKLISNKRKKLTYITPVKS